MRTKSLRRYETPLLRTGETIPALATETLRRKAERVRQVRGATQVVPVKVIVGSAIIVALSSATSSYFGTAAVPYLALIAVLAVYAYHQNKIEFLETQIEIQHNVLIERITELEVTASGGPQPAGVRAIAGHSPRQPSQISPARSNG